ncbi:MAG: hypothetical protein CM1200mP9_08500 [Gammaproteobacteria bacterium]|nr:MAG: hypothetical protein CM1200mP9_08500 [Gammaproteobacteria bacterium]
MHRAHLVVGGYPPGSTAGHDMDFARRVFLERLAEVPDLTPTVASDFADLGKWLPGTDFLLTYVAGPYPDEVQDATLREWISGKAVVGWVCTAPAVVELHASKDPTTRMVKLPHHDSLGCFFLNHPPIRRFDVNVEDTSHPIPGRVKRLIRSRRRTLLGRNSWRLQCPFNDRTSGRSFAGRFRL